MCFWVLNYFPVAFIKTLNKKKMFSQKNTEKKEADSSILICAPHLDRRIRGAPAFLTTKISPKYCVMDKMLIWAVIKGKQMSGSEGGEVKNMKKAVSWAIKGVMHVQWWCFLFFSYAHYLALFAGRFLRDRGGGGKKMYNSFCTFTVKCVNNTINCSRESIFAHAFFCGAALKTKDFKVFNALQFRKITSDSVKKDRSRGEVVFPAKFIDKYNDFIQYLNTHRVFTGTVVSQLFVFLFVSLVLKYVWAHLSWAANTSQRGFFFFFLLHNWLHSEWTWQQNHL